MGHRGTNVFLNDLDHITKSAATPIYGNIFFLQVNLVITRMSGCINPDRVINEARYSFENGLTSPAIAVVGGVHVISHAYREFSDKNYCV